MIIENRFGPNISNHKIDAPKKHLCHYHGDIKGANNSRVAVSLCSGIAGVLSTGNSSYYIEPLDEPDKNGEHLHIVYKKSLLHPKSHTCQTDGDWWNSWAQEMYRVMKENKTRTIRSDPRQSVPRYLECCVISDLKFIDHHKSRDVEEYVLTIMNIVSNYYHEASIGQLIDVVVVRLVNLHKEKEELDLDISPKASESLDSLCKWQLGLNPKDKGHPNHHDLAVLLTRHDLCSTGKSACGLLGLAFVGTVCNTQRACSINEDTGLALGATVAHEMGHNMGCHHDVVSDNGCEGKLPDGSGTVMNPSVGAVTTIWSNCSRSFIANLLSNRMGECLLNEPKDHNYPVQELLVGAIYDADQQCKFVFGDNYVHCKIGGDKICERLWCKEIGAGKCLSQGQILADGTSCAQNKWCYQKECIPIGERPTAIDGGWSDWGSWTDCSRTCGGGVTMRQRLCNNPAPSHGGRYCTGLKHEYKICNFEECDEHDPTYRELQCTQQNDIPFKGQTHKWAPFPAPDSDPNPCSLYCVNEKRSLVKLQPRVKDGTRCKAGSKDTCIHGACIPVGCDWVIESHAVEDICGVCNGDGTTCRLLNETYNSTKGVGYVKVTTIPKGSTNIDIEELGPSDNIFAVGNGDKIYFNTNNTEKPPGEFTIGGVIALYTKPEEDREELHIRGPTKEDIVFYYVYFKDENPGVRIVYASPAAAGFVPLYRWEFLEWGPCSARCGGGSEICKPSCIEQAHGKVNENLCDAKCKPEPLTRTCNLQKCRTKWKTWGWGPCSGCMYKTGERKRQVECVMELPSHSDGDEIIVDEKECCTPKPVTQELCNTSRPCNSTNSTMMKAVRGRGWNYELDEEFYKFLYNTSGVTDVVKDFVKRSDKQWLNSSTNDSAPFIEDKRDPKDFVLYMVDQSECGNELFNLTEIEFETVGDRVPSFTMGNQSQLIGEEAINLYKKSIKGFEKVLAKTRNLFSSTDNARDVHLMD
ncbi:A disintegrin and metalloproteinase with thrombospondin motifs 12 isoform X2 [Halyomorpha halys]